MAHPSRFVPVLALALLSVGAVHAAGKVQAATSSKPTNSTVSSFAAPNPTGLRSPFPAGITSGSGAGTSTDRVGVANSTNANVGTSVAGSTQVGGFSTGGAIGTTGGVDTSAAASATTVLGAGGAAGPSQYLGSGGSGLNAVDVARSFLNADTNHDGELSRAEASHLSISTETFEQMDRNFDGVISRSEYEDSLQ